MEQTGDRLISYVGDNGTRVPGVLISDRVGAPQHLLTATVLHDRSVIAILRQWNVAHPAFHNAAAFADPDNGRLLSGCELLTPILYPGAFYCAGANYWDHLEEIKEIAKRTTGLAPSLTKAAKPWFFIKTTSGSMIGTSTPARLPSFSYQVDWEAEVGVVISCKTRNIAEERAMDAVVGFVVVNDLSARDLMKRKGSPFVYGWIGQKCFGDGTPMGPWLTPAAYVGDPHNTAIKLWVNGVLKQNLNTSRLVHNMAE